MSKNSQFEKFVNKKKGSAVKEQLRQEKKLAKKQRAEAIEKRFEEKRKQKAVPNNAGRVARKEENPSRSNAPATDSALSEMPLNKFIAHSGVCSRRDAAELVKQGEVTVNGKVVTEPGTK